MAYDVCMVVHSEIMNDSRIWREARTLNSQGWKTVVICIALGNTDLPEVQEVPGFTIWRVKPTVFKNRSGLKSTSKFIQLLFALPAVLLRIRQSRARIYHGHDFIGILLLALAGIWQRPIVYDSHEVFFDRGFQGIPRWIIRLLLLLRPLEKRLAHHAAIVITTSDGHADQIVKNLNITRPIIVRNAVDLRTLADAAIEFPGSGQRLLIHSGGISVGRHLPELVQALKYLPDDVVLVLMGDGPLKPRLVESAKSLDISNRLIIVPPVNPDSIAPTLAQADISMILITKDNPSYEHSLPNKYFEAVAADLPMVVSGIPELAKMVETYGIGIICDPTNPEDIAEKTMMLLNPDSYGRYRENVAATRLQLNWENEEKKLINIYKTLFKTFYPQPGKFKAKS